MKKTVALMLVLCMMFAALPVFAESTGEQDPAGSGLAELLSGLLGEAGEKLKESDTGSALSGLLDELKKDDGEGASGVLSKVKDLLSKVLKDPTGKFAALLDKIKGKLGGGNAGDLGDLLGGGTSGGAAPEDDEDIEETMARLNKEAEEDTGENVPDKKAAESVEEFYGQWKETKFVLNNEEYDMSDVGEGAYIAENTYYITADGVKSPDYTYPETAELTIRDGVLKINSDGHWTTYVMTNSGEIVLSGSSLLCYFSRVDQ
ncbi:MAG: hypothetical protein ABTB30_15345 [Clostridia bacterium]